MLSLLNRSNISTQSTQEQKEVVAKQIAMNKARAAAILQAALRELESKTPSVSSIKKEIKC